MPLAPDLDRDNPAGGLCAQIRRDAEKEAAAIVAQARAEYDRILNENDASVAELRRAVLNAAYAQAAGLERRILSAIGPETRRVLLEAREKILTQIMERITALAFAFRVSPEYPRYLQAMIIDGALALDRDEAVIVASSRDRDVLTPSFVEGIERELKDQHHKNIALTFELNTGEDDIGAVLRSTDRRMECNNTFRARLAGTYERIRSNILQEVFGDNV